MAPQPQQPAPPMDGAALAKLKAESQLAFEAARLVACSEQHGWPFLRLAIYSMRPVWLTPEESERDGLHSMAVDAGWRLYLNMKMFVEWTIPQLASVLKHEVMHLVLDHCQRSLAMYQVHGLDQTEEAALIANLAHDLVVNQMTGIKETAPPGGVTLDKFPGYPPNETSEEYFARLLKDVKLVKLEVADHGSGATGVSGKFEKGGKDGKGGDDASAPAMTEGQAFSVRTQVAQAAKSAGNAPAELRRWAEDFLDTTVDWRDELRTVVRTAVAATSGRGDGPRHPRRPGRRAYQRDIIVLARRELTVRLGIVIDSSGSMGGTEAGSPLSVAAAEATALLRELTSPTVVLSVDADVAVKQTAHARTRLKLDGGGGTDMRIGYAALAEEGVDVGVVITDGYTPWPAEPPPYASITVLVGESVGKAPAWAHQHPHRVLYTNRESRREHET